METITKLILLSHHIFIFFTITSAQPGDNNPCRPVSCHGSFGPLIGFPFRLQNRQPSHCGYPGFDLHCDKSNRTIINLPKSGQFEVNFIDYNSQALMIGDPDDCLANRILNFTSSGSPFSSSFTKEYTFLNCSTGWTDYASPYQFVPVTCLGRGNYTVLATSARSAAVQVPPPCRRIKSVSVPFQRSVSEFYWSPMDLSENLQLMWVEPACRDCVDQGGICGYKEKSGLEVGCSRAGKLSGLPRSAKYGIVLGVGIPGLLCMIGLACYFGGAVRSFTIQRHFNSSELPTSTVSTPRLVIRAVGGLDLPTIASYPKTILGESGRLPKPFDGTCPICLCEYEPKETLRSIPECNHYFHAECIDEWLKINAACPLCRNTPDTSEDHRSSMLSSTSPSLTSEDHRSI